MAKTEKVTAKPVCAKAAARRYAKIKDPAGMQDAQGMAAGGISTVFKIGEAGELVATISKQGKTLWLDAAAGAGDVLEHGFELAEQAAKQAGCDAIGFQTARAGLVKKARQHGYTVTGFILRRSL